MLEQIPVSKDRMDREKLDGCDAQRLEMAQNGRLDEATESTARTLRNVRVKHDVAADVCLVDYRFFPGYAGRAIASPSEVEVHDPTLRDNGALSRSSKVVSSPGLGLIRAMNPIAINSPGPRVRHKAVPDLISVFGQCNAIKLAETLVIKKAKLNFRGGGGKQREINPRSVHVAPQRMRHTLPQTAPDDCLLCAGPFYHKFGRTLSFARGRCHAHRPESVTLSRMGRSLFPIAGRRERTETLERRINTLGQFSESVQTYRAHRMREGSDLSRNEGELALCGARQAGQTTVSVKVILRHSLNGETPLELAPN
jgi:hypothetical protein